MLTTFKTILTEKKQLINNIYLFTFKLVDPVEINFLPGQYLILKVNMKPRLYSIFSSNKVKNQIEFIIEIIPNGLASNYFLSLNINSPVEFSGPLGQFVLKENNKEKIFLATGTGVAPVLSILKSRQLPTADFKLFWGLKTYKDVYLFDEIKQFNPKICLSREESLEVIPGDQRTYFELGRVDVCFEKLLAANPSFLAAEYYLCGRKDITESLRLFLLSKNIPQENIFFEKF